MSQISTDLFKLADTIHNALPTSSYENLAKKAEEIHLLWQDFIVARSHESFECIETCDILAEILGKIIRHPRTMEKIDLFNTDGYYAYGQYTAHLYTITRMVQRYAKNIKTP